MTATSAPLVRVLDTDGRQQNTYSAIALLVENVSGINNGGIQQVEEWLRLQPLTVRARFAERCASLAATAAESIAATDA